jgi:hypothetical protein
MRLQPSQTLAVAQAGRAFRPAERFSAWALTLEQTRAHFESSCATDTIASQWPRTGRTPCSLKLCRTAVLHVARAIDGAHTTLRHGSERRYTRVLAGDSQRCARLPALLIHP